VRVVAVFVALLIVIPAAVITALWNVDPYEPPMDDPTVSVLMPVGLDRAVARVPARLDLEWSAPIEVLSQGQSGMVTSVHVDDRSVVTAGTALFDLDGSTVVAVGPGAVLWRDLAVGDEGRDVAALGRFLDSLGLVEDELDPPLDRVGPQLSAAIDAFLTRFGWPRVLRSARAGTGPVFPVDAVLYLPYDQLAIDEVNLVVGQPLPGRGVPVLVHNSTVVAASVTTDRQIDLPAEQIVFSAIGEQLSIELSDDASVPLQSLAEVAAVLEAGTAAIDGILTVTSGEMRYVPASAVVTGGSGQCVWGPTGPSPVTVVWSQGGRAYISAQTPIPEEIIVNPTASLADPSC